MITDEMFYVCQDCEYQVHENWQQTAKNHAVDHDHVLHLMTRQWNPQTRQWEPPKRDLKMTDRMKNHLVSRSERAELINRL